MSLHRAVLPPTRTPTTTHLPARRRRGTRLRPMVERRGYAMGGAQLRMGWLVHVVAVLLALGAVVGGVMAFAGILHILELL